MSSPSRPCSLSTTVVACRRATFGCGIVARALPRSGPVQLGLVGLGRMGANMARRWLGAGHECVGYARDPARSGSVARRRHRRRRRRSRSSSSLLQPPRAIWIMIPAAAVDGVIDELDAAARCRRHRSSTAATRTTSTTCAVPRRLANAGVHYLDVGVSGGIFGLEQGYCLMIGGDAAASTRLAPLFASLAPGGSEDIPPSAGTAPHGYLHCGPSGAGHFVKMVHNGIEYGLMAAYAEGFNSAEASERRPRGRHAWTRRLRRAPCKARTSRTTSISRRSPSCGVTAVSCARGCSTSPAPRSHATRTRRLSRRGLRLRRRPLDRQHGRRGRRARARARNRLVRALRLARPRRLREPVAVGDAPRVRRPPRAHTAPAK